MASHALDTEVTKPTFKLRNEIISRHKLPQITYKIAYLWHSNDQK